MTTERAREGVIFGTLRAKVVLFRRAARAVVSGDFIRAVRVYIAELASFDHFRDAKAVLRHVVAVRSSVMGAALEVACGTVESRTFPCRGGKATPTNRMEAVQENCSLVGSFAAATQRRLRPGTSAHQVEQVLE